MKMFSERYGFKKTSILKIEDMPASLKTRIWNVFHKDIFQQYIYYITHIRQDQRFGEFDKLPITYFGDPSCTFITQLWGSFFKLNLVTLESLADQNVVQRVKDLFDKLRWNEVYDFIEFFLKNFSVEAKKKEVESEINKVFEEEKTTLRLTGSKVIPITSEEEIKEIEQALDLPDEFKNTAEHLQKALDLLSKRGNPDYENSIKESISALESMVQILLGEKGTLGGLLKNLNVHPALKQGFSNIYGWTSDEKGIRHPGFGESFGVGFAEAKYMLVTASAFINYLKEKFWKNQTTKGVAP